MLYNVNIYELYTKQIIHKGPKILVLQEFFKGFLALWAKKSFFILFWPIFGIYIVTLVTFSSNLSTFKNNPKSPLKKIMKKNLKLKKKY